MLHWVTSFAWVIAIPQSLFFRHPVSQLESGFLSVNLEHRRDIALQFNYPTKWSKVLEKFIAWLVKKFLPFMEPEVSWSSSLCISTLFKNTHIYVVPCNVWFLELWVMASQEAIAYCGGRGLSNSQEFKM
jgi:hypothetical protein